jgi:tetratricopeptide (TPR) repeat protein
MDFFRQAWQWISTWASELPGLVSSFAEKSWALVPGEGSAGKLVVLGSVVGGLAGLPTIYWLWQKWRKTDIDSEVGRMKVDLRELKELLAQRVEAKDATSQGGDQPGAKQAEALIEQDIGKAISTLAEAGKIEALKAAKRGDTKAADEALAAKIAKIEQARTGAAKEEAALYRQRGGLAYIGDTDAAVRFYAKAAELDPDNAEGLLSLAQLQRRAGYLAAAKQSLERLIALGNRSEDEQQLHWAHFLLGDVEAAFGNRSAALAHHERGQTLVQALAARDPNNAEWQRDLSVSYERVGDISAARGDRDAALKAYKDGLDIAKQLAARDPSNAEWQRDIAYSYWRIGNMQRQSADTVGMLQSFRDALEICEKLTKKDPSNAMWQTDVAWSHYKFVQAASDSWPKHGQEGLAILKRLDAEGKLTADQKKWIAAFDDAMQELESAGPRR